MNIRDKLLLEIGISLVLFFGVAGLGIIMRFANGIAEKGSVLIMVVTSALFLVGCFLICVAVSNGVCTKRKTKLEEEVNAMQMCPDCGRVYDESEYSRCPECSGEVERGHGETKVKDCPNCGGIMYWDGCWECSDCGHEIHTGEDDYDSIMED